MKFKGPVNYQLDMREIIDLSKRLSVLRDVGENYPEQSRLLKRIAALYEQNELFDKAVAFYISDLQIYGDDTLPGIGIQTNIANIFRKIGKLPKSLEYFRKIEGIAEDNAWFLELQRARCSIGDIYLEKLCSTPEHDLLTRKESFDLALYYDTEALALALKVVTILDRSAGNPASASDDTFTLTESDFFSQKSEPDVIKANNVSMNQCANNEDMLDEDHLELRCIVADAYLNLGLLHFEMKNYDEAVSYYQKTLNTCIELQATYDADDPNAFIWDRLKRYYVNSIEYRENSSVFSREGIEISNEALRDLYSSFLEASLKFNDKIGWMTARIMQARSIPKQQFIDVAFPPLINEAFFQSSLESLLEIKQDIRNDRKTYYEKFHDQVSDYIDLAQGWINAMKKIQEIQSSIKFLNISKFLSESNGIVTASAPAAPATTEILRFWDKINLLLDLYLDQVNMSAAGLSIYLWADKFLLPFLHDMLNSQLLFGIEDGRDIISEMESFYYYCAELMVSFEKGCPLLAGSRASSMYRKSLALIRGQLRADSTDDTSRWLWQEKEYYSAIGLAFSVHQESQEDDRAIDLEAMFQELEANIQKFGDEERTTYYDFLNLKEIFIKKYMHYLGDCLLTESTTDTQVSTTRREKYYQLRKLLKETSSELASIAPGQSVDDDKNPDSSLPASNVVNEHNFALAENVDYFMAVKKAPKTIQNFFVHGIKPKSKRLTKADGPQVALKLPRAPKNVETLSEDRKERVLKNSVQHIKPKDDLGGVIVVDSQEENDKDQENALRRKKKQKVLDTSESPKKISLKGRSRTSTQRRPCYDSLEEDFPLLEIVDGNLSTQISDQKVNVDVIAAESRSCSRRTPTFQLPSAKIAFPSVNYGESYLSNCQRLGLAPIKEVLQIFTCCTEYLDFSNIDFVNQEAFRPFFETLASFISRVKYLSLKSIGLSDSVLRGCSHVLQLFNNLPHTQGKDDDDESIDASFALEWLDLSDNFLEDADYLVYFLKNFIVKYASRLSKLNLSNNPMNLDICKLMSCLRTSLSMKNLYLDNLELSLPVDRNSSALKSGFNHLSLRSCGLETTSILCHFNLVNIKSLDVSFNPQLENLDLVSQCRNLQSLYLESSMMKDDVSCSFLRSLQGLKVLNLSGVRLPSNITDSMPMNLEILILDDSNIDVSSLIFFLKQRCPSLQKLSLCGLESFHHENLMDLLSIMHFKPSCSEMLFDDNLHLFDRQPSNWNAFFGIFKSMRHIKYLSFDRCFQSSECNAALQMALELGLLPTESLSFVLGNYKFCFDIRGFYVLANNASDEPKRAASI